MFRLPDGEDDARKAAEEQTETPAWRAQLCQGTTGCDGLVLCCVALCCVLSDYQINSALPATGRQFSRSVDTHPPQKKRVICVWKPDHRLLNFLSVLRDIFLLTLTCLGFMGVLTQTYFILEGVSTQTHHLVCWSLGWDFSLVTRKKCWQFTVRF